MKQFGLFISGLIIAMSWAGMGQSQSYGWRSPIQHPIRLSGTFCELRTNHFHQGLDIKSSNGMTGDPVYAIGEGTLHRLRTQRGGYGLSVYIRHAEGYISVYGHLDGFHPMLDSLMTAMQMLHESYEMDIHCDSMHIMIPKGMQIGRMGNTGYSFGPHLHFEIREDSTNRTLNPLDFGFDVADDIAPTILSARMDALTHEGIRYGAQSFDPRTRDTILFGAPLCGLAWRLQDKMNQTPNANGVYSMIVRVNEEEIYRFTAGRMRFEDSQWVNVVKDIATHRRMKSLWYLSYSLPGAHVDTAVIQHSRYGWIDLSDGRAKNVEFTVEDHAGNRSIRSFWIKLDAKLIPPPHTAYQYLLPFDEPNKIYRTHMRLSCPEAAFYRNQYIRVEEDRDSSANVLSPTWQFIGDSIPFHKPCTLSLNLHHIPQDIRSHVLIARCIEDKQVGIGGTVDGDWMSTEIREYGQFALVLDTIAPKIKVVHFPDRCDGRTQIKFSISDNYPARWSGRDMLATAHIDGEWIPIAHDFKSETLSYHLGKLSKGLHHFTLIVDDLRGNRRYYQKEFVYQ